jgi:hypothetical protein
MVLPEVLRVEGVRVQERNIPIETKHLRRVGFPTLAVAVLAIVGWLFAQRDLIEQWIAQLLIITQSPESHLRIESLLAQLGTAEGRRR